MAATMSCCVVPKPGLSGRLSTTTGPPLTSKYSRRLFFRLPDVGVPDYIPTDGDPDGGRFTEIPEAICEFKGPQVLL